MVAAIPAAFSLASGIMSGMGQSAAAKYQAAQAKRAADVGKVKADDTDTQMREELQSTIGNIRAIRAAVGMGDSPTQQAVEDEERRVSNRERSIRVFNVRSQVAEDEAAARFYKSSARNALFGGVVGGLAGGADRLFK